MERTIISPQNGFQEEFLSTPADIAIGGGAAGAGKTFVLLLEPLRHLNTVKGFDGIIFRRTTPQITNPGGIWDASGELYRLARGIPKLTVNTWTFPLGNKLKFSHLEQEKNVYDYQGAEIPFIGFDELTHFTKRQFLYMLSRNRSTCGVRPYVRATCNPDPDSWVAEFLEWWIDQDTGFPIPERSGVLRYFIMNQDSFVWGDSYEDVVGKAPHIFNLPEFRDRNPRDLIKSVTFIPGSIYGNKELLEKDPGYLGNLLALPEDEQFRLLQGNWKIRQDGSALFNFQKINDLFSNFTEASDKRYITCDYARMGQDLTVIMTWFGYEVVRIEVMTKSSTVEAFNAIERERERVKIPRSQVIVDEDGVGGGVVDQSGGQYRGFMANTSALPNPVTKEKENYKNLKTQCYYRFADRVNAAQVAVRLDNMIIDGEQAEEVVIKGKRWPLRKLIIDDLRAVKKKDADMEGKKQINGKDEQKIILGGKSPDFGDSLSMRSWFELDVTPEPGIRLL